MNTEFNTMGPELENAVQQIREEEIDNAVIEAAAARVWANLAAQVHSPLRTCSDFQALIPDFKAGRLPESRALLVKDHLHECVACRRIYEGKVAAMPVRFDSAKRKSNPTVRWAIAAAVFAAAGLSVWIAYDQYGNQTGHAIVQAVNGTLYEILPAGMTVLAAGQELPDGVEIRTAKDSGAMIKLKDGSIVEMRERSGFSTSRTSTDTTIRLGRGSIIVQAAHRSSGHLFVATADCRVAVTGTVFSVTNGVKGSRVSVVAGEVHVTQETSSEKVLHPGDQAVTSANLEPVSVKDDIAWSVNRDKLVQQLENLRAGLAQVQLPQLRYSSKLLNRLPANTALFASIPNLAAYLGETQVVFRQKMNESPELRAWWSGNGMNVEPILEKLRAGSEYLGDEIAIAVFTGADGRPGMPVFLAESKREGFADFLKQHHLPLTVEARKGMLAFGPQAESVAAMATAIDAPEGGFARNPFYTRINESYSRGAGILVAADLSVIAGKNALGGARYFIAEEKQVNGQMEARATLGFDGPRTGIASWLGAPASMGALDYVSPEATIVTAFVIKNPAAIVDEMVSFKQVTAIDAKKALADAQQATGVDLRNDLAAALGGEFSLSLDGSAIPVPSWKLVIEVYDPAKVQATLQKMMETYNRETVKAGNQPVRFSQETVEGRTYYALLGSGGPLTEAHYTFADGYMLAAPNRALLQRALQIKTAGTSITRSAAFTALVPRDRYANFSAIIYQNLGTTLAPILGMFSGMIPQGTAGQANAISMLGNMKSTLIAAYGEPDRISIATSGNLMGVNPSMLLTGGLQGAIPFTQMMGTPGRAHAFK